MSNFRKNVQLVVPFVPLIRWAIQWLRTRNIPKV